MSDELVLRILEKIQDKISALETKMDTRLDGTDAKIKRLSERVEDGFAQAKADNDELRARLIESEFKLHTHLNEVLEAMGAAMAYRADLATRFAAMERRLTAVEKKLAGGT